MRTRTTVQLLRSTVRRPTPITSSVAALGPVQLSIGLRANSTSGPSSSQPQAGPSTHPAGPLPSKDTTSKAGPASKTQAQGKAPSKGADVVPPLSRPPGVPTPPTSRSKTWQEKKDEMLSEERHKAKRKALIKEATSGYFSDYNRARSASGGKLWTAPPVLIREDRALYFPDISGKALTGNTVHTTDLLKGKVSLLTIVSARISEEHVHSFTAPLLPDWPSSPLFQHVQINHQPNHLKSMLLSLFLSGLKRQVGEKDWGRYLVSSGAWNHFDIEGPLGIDNKLLGYVFLIDDNAKVRWAGCGPATEKEAMDLRTATAVLMKRVMEKQDADAEGSKVAH